MFDRVPFRHICLGLNIVKIFHEIQSTSYSILIKIFVFLFLAKQCPAPTPPSYGKVTLPCELNFGSTCPVSCLDGYILRGDEFMKCDIVYGKLKWNIRNIKCEGSMIWHIIFSLFVIFLFNTEKPILRLRRRFV